jgi:hypothetical protein
MIARASSAATTCAVFPPRAHAPKCASPIADSLKGILLHHASREYLERIHSGLGLVLNGILLLIVVMVVTTLLGVLSVSMQWTLGNLSLIVILLTLPVTIVMLVGYFRFSEPDPGFTGTESPNSARQVLRWTIIASVALTALNLILELTGNTAQASLGGLFGGGGAGGGTGTDPFTGVLILAFLLSVASLVVWVVQFIATMQYTAWLGGRVPDDFIVRRALSYRWVLPLIYVVGFFCAGLGPLVALVLYWNLLDRLRKHTKSILASGSPATLTKMVA